MIVGPRLNSLDISNFTIIQLYRHIDKLSYYASTPLYFFPQMNNYERDPDCFQFLET